MIYDFEFEKMRRDKRDEHLLPRRQLTGYRVRREQTKAGFKPIGNVVADIVERLRN